jgi:hypothetical protein
MLDSKQCTRQLCIYAASSLLAVDLELTAIGAPEHRRVEVEFRMLLLLLLSN